MEAGRLSAERRPYAFATVVRVERPTSAREGNHAVITASGEIVGWIGGACSEPTVVREAIGAMADGRPRLVAIEGACASEGLVEVFIEPQLPEPLLAVVGESPAARALGDLAARVGWRVVTAVEPGVDAVVVATMGHGDEEALQAALATPAGYVGLVASRRRGEAVRATLQGTGLAEGELARVRCPAGLDLGPSSQEEIAVAILAELVAWRHETRAAQAPPPQKEALDPVCGMTVAVTAYALAAEHAGTVYHFCGAGCRARFTAEPARYLASGTL
jgi:xanthine dehydrogenase accessory factor